MTVRTDKENPFTMRGVLHAASMGCRPLLIVLAIGLTIFIARPGSADDLLDDDKDVGGLLDDMRDETNEEWWNKDWKFRRKVSIEDPRLLVAAGAVFLQEPDPLLLYNTGHAQGNLADLRVVAADGTVLPSGVTNFGRDDGTSNIWFIPPERATAKGLTVYLYYGNTAAKATGDALPEEGGTTGDPQFVQVSTEQTPEGTPAAGAARGSFFKNLVAVEAEHLVAEDKDLKDVFAPVGLETAGGEAFLSLKAGQTVKEPVTLSTSIKVPEAGTWYAHVRFKAHDGKKLYAPFQLLLAGKEYSIGAETAGVPAFRWQTTKVELPLGETKLGFRLGGPGAPDCVILTKDARYRPDYRDITGPVWMRFKVTGNDQPFYVDLFGMHTTFSVNGMQGSTASYLFRDRLVLPKKTQQKTDNGGVLLFNVMPSYAKDLIKDPEKLLKGDEWTPWGKSLAHGSWTWFSEIRFLAGGAAPRALSNLKVTYEFATRPDNSRIFREGVEDSGPTSEIYVHMPPSLDFKTMRDTTVSFSEWARQRFAMAESLGFKSGEGPKKIVFSTMAGARGTKEAELILKTLDWIGLNTVTLGAPGSGRDVDKLLEASDMTGNWTFARTETLFERYFYIPDPKGGKRGPTGVIEKAVLPVEKLAGLNYTQSVEKMLAEGADKQYRGVAESMKQNSPWQFAHTRYNDLDDEIGPIVGGHLINKHPLFKGLFVEYLKAQGLDSGFFGAKTWDDFKAVDYGPEFSKKEERMRQVIQDEENAAEKLENDTADLDGGKTPILDEEDEIEVKTAKPGVKPKEVAPPVGDPVQLKQFEKRAFHWTQRFRSYATAMWYRHHTNAVTKYFPAGIKTCVNLQASPVQAGRMWDGALNVFDLGRLNGFTAMQVEDWHSSPVNVRFGMDMMRAAARKNNQETTALVVGGHPGQRVITNLMEETRNYLFYLYGPIYSIGPVWAEDKATQRDLGLAMRKVARAETDILAAKNRQRTAAVLVANTSEINGQYYAYPFDHERMAIYAALADQQIPVELVGEEEIVEDDALKKYKVLYVCDPHVDSRAQKKIKEWVAAGGVLWADYAGLARQEYDSPSRIFDEVFGLQARGDIMPYMADGFNGKFPAGATVKVPKSEYFDGEEIKGIHFSLVESKDAAAQPDYKLGSGKALATFADGKPAIVHNKFGKGEAFLNGFPAGLSYSSQYAPHGYNFAYVARSAPATKTRGQLMTAAARAAGVEPHTKIDAHMLFTAVHDGPGQTVIYLVNQASDIKGEPLEVNLPKAPKSAYSGSTGKEVEYKMAGNRATVPLKLAAGETDIIVFKY